MPRDLAGGLQPPQRLGAHLGLFGATMVGIGAMVGAGIFVLSGVAMHVAGPGAILAFALNGALALVTAFSFAELAAAFPESGGSYVFAKKVFPIGGAFAMGWIVWFAYVVACALYSLGFASFLGYTITQVTGAALPVWFAPVVACATAVAAMALLGVRGAAAGNWISFAKVIAFLILIVAGLALFLRRPGGTLRAGTTPMLPFEMTGVFVAMGYTFIALEGFEIISTIGEEVRSPARTIPRAMFLSIGTTLVIYMGLLFVLLTVGGPPDGTPAWRDLGEAGETAVAVGAERFAGPLGSVVVVIAGLLSTFSALAATLLAASRVSFSMARDRALPRGLSRLGGPSHAPHAALGTSALLVILVVVVTADVEVAGAAASLVFLISFALTNAAGLLVRLRVGALASWRAPLYPALPILGITACLALALFQAVVVPLASLVLLVWLVTGGVLYRLHFGSHARTVSARAEAWDDVLVRLRGRSPLVLVPIANPDRAEPLLRFAHALAAPGTGRVLALTVGQWSRGDSGMDAYARAETVLRQAAAAACRLERPFEGAVVLASDATDAIARTAAERHPETVLLGMSSMARDAGVDVLEEIIARTTSDVVVLNAPRDWSLDGVRRVLLPVAGRTPHDPLRARVLGMLLRRGDCRATLLRILRPGGDAGAAERDLLHQAEDLGLGPDSCVLETSADPVEVIVRHSANADLLVLGFGRGGGRRRLIGGFALQVVGGAGCPVVAIAEARRGWLATKPSAS